MPAKKTTKTSPKATTRKASPPKKKLSALDAAAQVLTEAGGSMTTKELIEAMAAKKLWESPNGKTPAATLFAALTREITTKGKDSRFKKTQPGKFAATGAVGKAADEPVIAKATKPKRAKRKAAEPAADTQSANPEVPAA